MLNENSQGRDAIALIGLLSAYLLGCYDGEYRLAFSVLSSVYQMYRESERYLTQQKALVKMRAKEEEQRGRGGFSRNRRDEDSDSDVDADDDSYSSSRRKGRKRSSTKRRADSDMY